jgi:hypothetical protein
MEKQWRFARYSNTPLLQVATLGPQGGEECIALAGQLLLQLRRAIAVATSPRFRPVLVPAVPAGMRVFHRQQIKIFLQ